MEGVMNYLSSCYFLPKVVFSKAIDFFEGLEATEVYLYAVLFTKSLVFDYNENPGVLLGDDGRRLFITCSYEDLARELGWLSIDNVKYGLDVLAGAKFVNVVEQRNGMPPVIFVHLPVSVHTGLLQSENSANESSCKAVVSDDDELSGSPSAYHEDVVVLDDANVVDSAGIVDADNGEQPLGAMSDGVKEIVGCWFNAFKTYPEIDVLNALVSYLEVMDVSIVKYAIYACENDCVGAMGLITKVLEECKISGIKHIDELEDPSDDAEEITEESGSVSLSASSDTGDAAGVITEEAAVDSSVITFANRITALREACKNEFSALDINEVWVSMQEVVDAAYWDNYAHLYDWLKSKYEHMDARVKGGERVVRLNMLMRIIADD
jgi:hypothetical protein